MILDPIIVKCPHCKTISIHYQMMSYTIHKAEYWSDGKCDSMGFHYPSLLIKCRTCKQFYWIDDNNNQISRHHNRDEFEKIDSDQNIPNLEIKEEVNDIDNFYNAIINGFGDTTEREIYLRKNLWWKINDLIRYHSRKKFKLLGLITFGRKIPINKQNRKSYDDYNEIFRENLTALAGLLDEDKLEDMITKAEIYRELAEFERSKKLIAKCRLHNDYHASEGPKKAVKKILRHIKRNNKKLFQM